VYPSGALLDIGAIQSVTARNDRIKPLRRPTNDSGSGSGSGRALGPLTNA